MPEGPEIRRIADRLEKTVCHRPIEQVWFQKPGLKKYEATLSGGTVTSVKTKGKALLTAFDCGLTVYSHNQLYGRWYFNKAGRLPDTARSLRWRIDTDQDSALLYSASDIAVLKSSDLGKHPFLASAGIDILSDKPGVKELSEYLAQPRFARRALGGLLLDQHFVAGIGNYLRSEILFAAGLHPAHKIGDLDGHGRRRLARQIICITERAYKTGGITNDEALAKRLAKNGWSRREYRHWVFSREQQICHQCDDTIVKTVVASRRLYYCPTCQEP